MCVCVCHSAYVEVGGQLGELVLSLHQVDPRNWTQVTRLGDKFLYPLNQVTASHRKCFSLKAHLPRPKEPQNITHQVSRAVNQSGSTALVALSTQCVTEPMCDMWPLKDTYWTWQEGLSTNTSAQIYLSNFLSYTYSGQNCPSRVKYHITERTFSCFF